MENPDQVVSPVERPTAESPEQPKPRQKRSQSKRNPRGEGGDPNRQRSRNDRHSMSGFGDGIERAFCVGIVSSPPRSYPAQHRTGVAVMSRVVVARSGASILFCDCEHAGPHIWPNGDVVGDGGGN